MSTDHADYDVVVIGFGAAGACAAIAAAEGGARVLVVDRALGGGASALSGGIVYAGGGTPYQREAGYHDDANNMFDYLQQEVGDIVDEVTLRHFCDGSVDRLAWLEKHGAQFSSSLCDYKTSYPTDKHYLYFSGNEKAHPYRLHATPAPRGHRQIAKGIGSGRVLWAHLRDAAVGLGVTVMPRTRVDDLVLLDSGIREVRCRSWVDDGSAAAALYARTSALGAKFTNWLPPIGQLLNRVADRLWKRRAVPRTFTARTVILAAGGFAFNQDMLRRHSPQFAQIRPLGTEGDDGKGIELGVAAGGATAHLERVTAWRFLSPPSAMIEGITVGVNGDRIANEDLYGATHSDAMVRRFGGKGFLVVDSEIWRRARSQISDQTEMFQRLQLGAVFITGHCKAATLEQLATKLGISPSGLAATVAGYNAAIVSGGEDPGHKASGLCAPIASGPFYGIDISVRPSLTYPAPGLTLGGLRVDGGSGQVLTETGLSISGLYAVGRTAVGVCSNSYVSGLALADCVYSGKRAGEHAARSTVGDEPTRTDPVPASSASLAPTCKGSGTQPPQSSDVRN
jgi:3-oxo-5alpha-steroid 4-dehydrogenase